MLLFLGSLGAPEIVLILAMALLLFGPKKLPELGRSLGKGLREFKKGTSGLMDSLNDEVNAPVKDRQAQPDAVPKTLSKASPAEPQNGKEQAQEAVVINTEEGSER